MRDVLPTEMMDFLALFAVLFFFFSLDIRNRVVEDDDPWHQHLFSWMPRIGGVSIALAIALCWINLFAPDDNPIIHVWMVAVPGSIAVLCTIVLGLEMLFLPNTKPASK